MSDLISRAHGEVNLAAYSSSGRASALSVFNSDPFTTPPTLNKIRIAVTELLGTAQHWNLEDVEKAMAAPDWWPRSYLGVIFDTAKEVEEEITTYKLWWAHRRECAPLSVNLAIFEIFNKYHFVQSIGSKPAVVHWDSEGRFVAQTHAEFKGSTLRERSFTWPKNGGKFADVPISELWLKTPNPRNTFEGIGFFPGIEARAVDGRLNLWRGWNAVRVEVVDDRHAFPPKARRWLEHVHDYLCDGDPEVFSYVLRWIADALNRPMRTPETAIVLTGAQGAGKGLFATTIQRFFAPHTLTLDKPNALTGNFNAHLEDALMVFADEALFAGDRKAAATMKSLITSREIAIERKGFDLYMAPKRFRLIIATNDPHAINAEAGDRRYLVLKADAFENNDNPEYFEPIFRDLEDGGYDELFSWFTSPCWRDVELGKRPVTAELQKQKDLSLRGPEAVVHALLESATPLCETECEGDRIFIPTAELAAKARLDVSAITKLGRLLAELGGENGRGVIAGTKVRGYWLPALPTARRAWEKYLGRKISWPPEVVSWSEDGGTRFYSLVDQLIAASHDLPPETRHEWSRLLSSIRTRSEADREKSYISKAGPG